MKMNIRKKLILFAILSILLSSTIKASNVINTSETVDVGTQIAESVEAASVAAYNDAYIKEMEKAFKSVEVPEVANFPTLLTQPSFHPEKTDYFGKKSDDFPIFRVLVSENDTERKKMVGLTFDSAYINKYTYKILDILDKYNAKATFFMTHEYMSRNSNQVLDIVKRGHEIGNHSTTHPDFNKVTDAKVIVEVLTCHNYIKTLYGADMCLFRFPYGSYSPRTVSLLKNLGYYPIQWTFDSVDWKNQGLEYLIKRFNENKDQIEGGSIILFHNGATYTPEYLPYFFDILNEKGLKAVRVSDLIYRHNFSVDVGVQYENSNEPQQ